VADRTLPADWPELHAAAWDAGWSLGAGSAERLAGWTYAARRRDDLTAPQPALAWETASDVRAWRTAGAPALPVAMKEAA
jgi:hypothetical protein